MNEIGASQMASVKEHTCQCPVLETLEMWVRYVVWEDPLEEGMATHFSVLAWRIPWTEEPGGLQSIESQRVGHEQSDLAGTHLSKITVTSKLLLATPV